MKIKVKVKTLILVSLGILFFIFGVIPFANIELANYLSNKKPEIAEKLYDNYIKYPSSLRKDEALYKQAENIMGGFSRYNIMMGGKMWNKLLDYDSVTKAIENSKKIIKGYPKSDYYTLAYKNILDSYIYLGDLDNLEELLHWGKSKNSKDIRQISILYNGYNHFANREYGEAEDVLKSFTLGNKDMDYMYYFLKGHIKFMREDFDKALEYYNKASEIGWKYRNTFFGNVVPDGRKAWLNELDFHKGENKIKGRVTVDGVGVPFVEVYLQYIDQGYSSSGIDFVAITDKDGYYETIGIKEGRYDLGIGIGTPILFDKVYLDKKGRFLDVSEDMEYDFKFVTPMNVISPRPVEVIKNNTFVVEWERVEGADYYTVFSVGFEDPENMKGSSMTFALVDENKEYEIKEDKGVFNIQTLRRAGLGSSFRTGTEMINPTSIIGYFYNGIEMPIIVNAYDKEGNKLNSSMPLATYYNNTPSIKIEGELTEGEKLILNKEYEKAIEHYENILIEDENNIEALFYLTRFNMLDWKKGKKDIAKAIDYLIRLYNISGDTELLSKLLLEMEPDECRQYKESIAELFNMIPEEKMTSDLYWSRGNYYIYIGEFEEAKEDFLLTENIFLPDIIYIDLYYSEYERAIDFLRSKDTTFYYMNKEKLIEGIELLSKLPQDDKEYIIFKEYLSRLLKREEDYEERKSYFNKVYSSIKNDGIKIILNEIKADNHWD